MAKDREKQVVSFRASREQVDKLSELSEATGQNRSAVLSELVDRAELRPRIELKDDE